MAEPTPYDLQQDAEINELQKMIRAEYEPPAGAQYSYPVANQGITQEQYALMNLTDGDATIIRDAALYPWRLVGHDTDSETNQRNTLILKVAERLGYNEAVLAGFYFRQTEDIELPFPAVTSPTTYHVTVTYDPRNFKTSPLRLEVWAGDPPRAHGQQHIVIQTVRREPNQLLSQAARQMVRPYISPLITAVSDAALPNPADVHYGTLAVTRNGGAPGAGQVHASAGTRWDNLLAGEWEPITAVSSGWTNVAGRPVMVRRTVLGYQMRGSIRNEGATNATQIGRLPEGFSVTPLVELPGFVLAPGSQSQTVELDGRDIRLRLNHHSYRTDRVTFDGVIIPYS